MSSPAQFAAKMSRAATGIRHADRTITEAAALTVKRSVQNQLLAAGVVDGKLRGVGKRGARVGVRYRRLAGDEALVFMFGPAQLIESDTKPHRIPRERRTARAKKRVVVIPGVGVRAYADHPGTRGKHPWRKGVTIARPRIGPESQTHLVATLRKALR